MMCVWCQCFWSTVEVDDLDRGPPNTIKNGAYAPPPPPMPPPDRTTTNNNNTTTTTTTTTATTTPPVPVPRPLTEKNRLLPEGKVIQTYDDMSVKESRFRRSAKAATDISYPAYGVTGPIKEKIPSPGDRKLAQSAQMYHYQHQKQQMIAMEKANGDMKHDASEDESEEDNVEGDYTVYECPGLAPTGEMEVKNPLFCGEEVPPPPVHHEHAGDPHHDPQPQGQGQQPQGRQSPSSPSGQSHRSQ